MTPPTSVRQMGATGDGATGRSAGHPDHQLDTVVVMGVSGVGKTTVADGLRRATGWAFAEGDTFHPPTNVAKMTAGTPLDDQDRLPWLAALRDWIYAHEADGFSSIVTCSALKRSYRDILREGNRSVRFCVLAADGGQLRNRVEHRQGHYMPALLLQSQFDALQPLDDDEPGVTVDAGGSPDDVVRRALDALGLPALPADQLTTGGNG